jgi:uncharacterized protein YqjF (DUF2071 family)
MSVPTIEQRMALQHRPDQPAIMHQRWEDLLFLHWQANADDIQRTLPPGLTVDCHDGKAYLAIVPFKMRAIRPRGLPPVPYLSNFLECNVRTYVHDAKGVPGVWFYSLDTDRWLAYWVARKCFRLPYVWSSMNSQMTGHNHRYQVRRRGEDEPSDYVFESEAETRVTDPGSLDFFLLERYLLYSFNVRKNQLHRGRVYHKPYQMSEITNHRWNSNPIAWNALPEPTGPPVHACYSKRVVVEVFPLERVSG